MERLVTKRKKAADRRRPESGNVHIDGEKVAEIIKTGIQKSIRDRLQAAKPTDEARAQE